MAIAGGDGSIILTTKVEDAGLKKGLSKLVADQKKQLQSLTREYAKLIINEKQNTKEAKNLRKQINNLSKDIKSIESALNSFGNTSNTTFSRVGNALKSLGGYLAVAFSITKIIQFSNEASEFATQTEASVQRLIDIYGSASKSVGDFIDQNARALGMSRAAAAEFSAVYGNLFSVWADQETNAELTNRYLNTTAVVASKTGRTMQDVQERIRSGLLGNTEAVEDLGIFVNIKTIEMTEAFKRVADGRSWAQLNAYEQSQVRTLAILEQATNKYGSTVANTTALTRSQYQAAYEDFKNTWGQVVNKILIPVLKVATAVLNVLTRGMQIIAGLASGTTETMENYKEQEISIGGAVDNQEALTDAVKETAKAQEKSLAGFDKINKLTEENASSASGSGGGASVGGGAGSISLPDMNYDNSFVDQIDKDLAAIMGTVGFALAAIGIIMICFGQIGWGIGFLIAGATTFAVSQAALSEGADAEKVKNIMNGIIAGISLLALVLGIILVATGGSLPLGIGLIIVGAAGLATEAALNWDVIKNSITKFFQDNAGLIAGVSLALLVIGLILCCTGVALPLGIGLIATGAVGLVSTAALNWNTIQEKVSGAINGIMEWLKTYGLIVLGVILCFSGIGIGFGISMIRKGASNLAELKPQQWNAIKEKMSSVFDGLMKWLKTYGLLILGVVLCFSGIGIGYGITMIRKAAGNLVELQSQSWNTIVTKVKDTWKKIKTYWDNNIAKYFTKAWWSTLAKNVANGFIGGIEGMINGCINGFEKMINWIVKALNKIHFDVPDWVPSIGGKRFGFNLKTVDLKNVAIPRLAQGAVIPPNREFLAVLGDQKQGTNIETPLKTMIEAFNVALDRRDNIGGGEQTIIVTLDGEVLFRNVVKKNKNYTIATGVNPLGV